MTPLPLAPPPDADGYPPLSALNDLLFCERPIRLSSAQFQQEGRR